MQCMTCVIAHPFPGALRTLQKTAETAGLIVKGTVSDETALKQTLMRTLPCILFLHILMPGMNPDPETFVARLRLFRRPAIVYLSPDGLPCAHAPCISATPTAEQMRTGVRNAYPPAISPAFLQRAETLLSDMGIPDAVPRRWLADAVCRVALDGSGLDALSDRIFSEIASLEQLSARRVSDSMRRMIDRAWTTGSIDEKYTFFGNTIDAQRGKPTLSAFIATAAEFLRETAP